MKKEPLTSSALNNETEGQGTKKDSRLPYEAPELISYNTSEITTGGVKVKAGFEFVATDTSYKPS